MFRLTVGAHSERSACVACKLYVLSTPCTI